MNRLAACALLFGACGAALAVSTGSATATTAPSISAPNAESFCSRVAAGATAGDIADPELIELSGLAASHAHPGVLWANNDSGDSARLFALSDTGAALGVYTVRGAEAIDWEDIATGPGPVAGQSYLYIADIGDNQAGRDHVTVYRVAEPSAAPDGGGGSLDEVEAFALTYPTGAEDAESLFVDPVTGDVYIVTKQVSGASRVLEVAAGDLDASMPTPMTQVAAIQIADTGAFAPGTGLGLPSTMATSADISPDGRTIVVRTYQQVLAFTRADGQAIAAAMSTEPCSAPQMAEPQGEAIAFAADGSAYYTSGESQLAVQSGAQAATDPLPLARFDIAPAPAPAPANTAPATTAPAAAAAPTTTADPAGTDAPTTDATHPTTAASGGGSSNAGIRFTIAGVIVVLALIAVVLLARRRRTPPPGR